jgi:hypothetical protein
MNINILGTREYEYVPVREKLVCFYWFALTFILERHRYHIWEDDVENASVKLK